jgi:hypothetical protein
MNIQQISTGSGQQSSEALRALALAEFIAKCPLAPYLDFYKVRGNADTPRAADSAFTAGTTRAIGNDYTPQSRTPQFGSIALKLYGDVVKTDIAYERRGFDIGSQRSKDLKDFAGSLGRFFANAIVNHDGTNLNGNPTIKGLLKLATDNAVNYVFDTVDGGELPTGNGNNERKQQDKFIEWLAAHIATIIDGPSCLLMNGWMSARLASVGRGYLSTSNVADIFGRNQVVTSFAGIPIVNAGYGADSVTEIITKTEEAGGSGAVCTSIYLMRFGEEQNLTIATNVGIDVKDLGQVGTQLQTLVEFDVDSALLNAKALKRLSGIIL